MENMEEDRELSSGAEKVEKIAGETREQAERLAADERVRAAQERAKERERASIERAEREQEKLRLQEQAKKQRLAEAVRRREEKERARLQKAEARERAREERAREKERRSSGSKGVGGWIAAVVSLGVTCLTLAAVVTAGAVRMNELEARYENAAREAVYEMAEAAEAMDASLCKLRVSEGRSEQRRLLTEVAVESALLESALEKLPLQAEEAQALSDFINRTGGYARALLERLNAGGSLGEREAGTLDYLHAVNVQLLAALNAAEHRLSHEELAGFFKGSAEGMNAAFKEMAGYTRLEAEGLVEPPFAGAGNVGENRLAGGELSEARAVELAESFLAGYHIKEAHCTGEAHLGDAVLYNVALTDGETAYEVSVAKKDGSLVYFSAEGGCGQQNFELEACDGLAREFLKKTGIEGVERVWASEYGGTAELAYVPVQGGVYLYSDLVRVRVCESKGRVVGLDALQYRLNHHERTLGTPRAEGEIAQYLSPRLEVTEAHLALVPVGGEEKLSYQFSCRFGEEEYIACLDAKSGEELMLYRIFHGEGGDFLR